MDRDPEEQSVDNETELREKLQEYRTQQRGGKLGWIDYGLKLVSICERITSDDCLKACSGSVALEAQLNGPERLRKGVTDKIRELEKGLADCLGASD